MAQLTRGVGEPRRLRGVRGRVPLLLVHAIADAGTLGVVAARASVGAGRAEWLRRGPAVGAELDAVGRRHRRWPAALCGGGGAPRGAWPLAGGARATIAAAVGRRPATRPGVDAARTGAGGARALGSAALVAAGAEHPAD